MGENRKIYAALLGAGTVGSGVYRLAGMQEEDICLKTGAQLEIKKDSGAQSQKGERRNPSGAVHR